MNLSHNGTLATTNIVWKNLDNSIKLTISSINKIEANLLKYYNEEYKTLQELELKSAIVIRGLR